MISALPSRSRAGFSLVEVALAIGIIAFAFVALLGLIPTGLNTFRDAIDKTNETIIVADLNSMLQVTDWSKLAGLDYNSSQEIYYYNDEGRPVDTKSTPSANSTGMIVRVYGAKLFVEPFHRPESDESDPMKPARRVIVLIANLTQKPAKDAFDSVANSSMIGKLPAGLAVKSHALLINQMDSSVTQL
jgi:uncharacterized protein (TIGR02598 family)